MATSLRDVPPRTAILAGGLGVLAGLVVLAPAVGVVSVPDGSFRAPRWIVAACGGAFLAVGVLAVASGVRSARSAPRGPP